MDQTSHTLAVILPMVAVAAVVGLITFPVLAVRSVRDNICPQRARREAAAREFAAADPVAVEPRPGVFAIGAQRGVRHPVDV